MSMSLPTSVAEIVGELRRSYHDAVRLTAGEEILAELAEEAVTARLHADTAHFHHGGAHAYAQALELLLFSGEKRKKLDLHEDKEQARHATRGADLAGMRCRGRRYQPFDPSQL
jgi:hypothetical protein